MTKKRKIENEETKQEKTVLDGIVRVGKASLLHALRDALDERLLVVTTFHGFLDEAEEQRLVGLSGPTASSGHHDENIAAIDKRQGCSCKRKAPKTNADETD